MHLRRYSTNNHVYTEVYNSSNLNRLSLHYCTVSQAEVYGQLLERVWEEGMRKTEEKKEQI